MHRPLSGVIIPGKWLIIWTMMLVAVCCLPALLMAVGVDFGNAPGHAFHRQIFESEHAATEAMFHAMSGSFLHSIVEWSAFCVAVVIALAAILHYRLNGQNSTPIISLILLSAGTMDAFHVLAADRLIPTVPDNATFIPFTWALSRFFNAGITIIGVGLLVFTHQRKHQRRVGLIVFTSLLFAGCGSLLVWGCARYEQLPTSIYPEQFISRPWDIPPLVMFIVASLVVIPSALQRHRNVFLLTIWLSMIPQIATQLYMALGSRALFDSAFNVAHVIKILAYITPLGGLCVDYVLLHMQLERSVRHISRSRTKLREKHDHLQAVLVNIGDAVLTVSRHGQIKTANPTATQLFGHHRELLCLMHIDDVLKDMPVSFQGICHQLDHSQSQWQSAYYLEATGWHADQHGFDAEIGVNRLSDSPHSDYVVSIHDCTQIHHVTRELAHARDQAHLAAEARDRLLSNVSFELRTPLNAMMGFATLLEDQLRDLHMNELIEDASEIRHAGHHLQEMINEILDLATINQGKLDITIGPVNLKSLCQHVMQSSLGIIEASSNIMHLHCDEDQLVIQTDSDRLHQILFNLLTNAAKMTQDSRIDLHVQLQDYHDRPGVMINISIAGLKLSDSQQQLIFEIFGNTSEPSHP
ncbi:MAG: histidine kinase dimerization/phospho-acceptor domain-containing protein, partial [Phycisphaeraceae bacterium JB051]